MSAAPSPMLQLLAGKRPGAAAARAQGHGAAKDGAADANRFARLIAELLGNGARAAGSRRPGGKTLPHAGGRHISPTADKGTAAAAAVPVPLAALLAHLAAAKDSTGAHAPVRAVGASADAGARAAGGNGKNGGKTAGAASAAGGDVTGSANGGKTHNAGERELRRLEAALLRGSRQEHETSGAAGRHAAGAKASAPDRGSHPAAAVGGAAAQGTVAHNGTATVPSVSVSARANARDGRVGATARELLHALHGSAGQGGGAGHRGGASVATQHATTAQGATTGQTAATPQHSSMQHAVRELAAAASNPARAPGGTGPGPAAAAALTHRGRRHEGDVAPESVTGTGTVISPGTHAGTPSQAAPPLRPQGGTQQFAAALGKHLGVMINHGNQHAVLHLDPPQLGTVQVHLNAQQNNVTAWFVSPHADVRQALEAGMPALRQALAQQGVSLSGSFVADQNRQQPFDQRPKSGRWTGPGGLPEEGEAPLAVHESRPGIRAPDLRGLSVYV